MKRYDAIVLLEEIAEMPLDEEHLGGISELIQAVNTGDFDGATPECVFARGQMCVGCSEIHCPDREELMKDWTAEDIREQEIENLIWELFSKEHPERQYMMGDECLTYRAKAELVMEEMENGRTRRD